MLLTQIAVIVKKPKAAAAWRTDRRWRLGVKAGSSYCRIPPAGDAQLVTRSWRAA